MIAQLLTPDLDPCMIADRWIIAPELASRLLDMTDRLPFQVQLISGFRDREEQEALIREGRGAPFDVSTHTSCPATGADLWPTIHVTDVVKAELGAAATYAGLRWGGGSTPDPQTGIPWDWNHVDLGPRAR